MIRARDVRCFFLALCSLSFAPLACSSSGGSSDGAATAPGATDPSTDPAGGGGGAGSGAPGTWARITLDPGVRTQRVAADVRGVWISEVHGPDQHAVGAGRIRPNGTYERVFEETPDAVTFSNFVISAIAPVDDTSAAITAEWFTRVIGGKTHGLESTNARGSALFAREAFELWVGGRVGPLARFTLPSEDRLVVPITPSRGIRGVWATSDAVFVATEEGIRQVPQPLPSDWNGDAIRVAQGDFMQMNGLPDRDIAYAVGKNGAAARYDAASRSWQAIRTGAKGTISDVAIAREDDVWTSGEDGTRHFDGKDWTSVASEPGMPAALSSIAAQPDGTLWAIADGALYRRAPGAVAGSKTDGGAVVTPDGGACGFAEPNDTSATAYPLKIPTTVDGCAPPQDLDIYAFVSPKGAPAGGFYSIEVDDLDSLELLATLYDATASEELWSMRALNGGASTTLRGHVPVRGPHAFELYVGGALRAGKDGRYHASITYTPFADALEPNDAVGESKTITAGTPVSSLLPTGMPDFGDYYVLARSAGPFTVTLSDVAAGSIAKITAYRASSALGDLGTVVATATSSSAGASVTLNGSLASSGYLRILVEDLAERDTTSAAPPAAFTQPYTLLVSP